MGDLTQVGFLAKPEQGRGASLRATSHSWSVRGPVSRPGARRRCQRRLAL